MAVQLHLLRCSAGPVSYTHLVLAGGILLIAGRRQQAEAALDPTRYSKEHPFVVLEIVPYEGQGQWGYLVEGQEPVTVEAINRYYTEEQELKDYWSLDWGNNNATFFIEFPFSGLVRDKENRRYANNNIFVKNILCQSGKKAEDWAGKMCIRDRKIRSPRLRLPITRRRMWWMQQ